MAYFICEIKTDCEHEGEIIDLLTRAGASGVAAEGASLIRETIREGHAEIWDKEQLENDDQTMIVKGFFPVDEQTEERKEQLIAATALYELIRGISVTPVFRILEDEEWQDNWKQYYKPFRVGKRLVIKPTWEPYEREEGDIVIELDPGLAFGTGSHPTTNGALRLLENTVKEGMNVLDCGCGSGILAVAAAFLGAKKVYAVDIDHEAILSAVSNIRMNGLMDKIEVFCADVTKRSFRHLAPFDIVVANIVAEVIIPMLPYVAPLMDPGAVLIVGGIISHRKDDVFAALGEHGYAVKEVLTEGDWITLAAEKTERNQS